MWLAAIYMNQNKLRNLSHYQKLFHQLFKLGSAHPELADLPNMRDVRKIQSLEYQIDACRRSRAFFRGGKMFRLP